LRSRRFRDAVMPTALNGVLMCHGPVLHMSGMKRKPGPTARLEPTNIAHCARISRPQGMHGFRSLHSNPTRRGDWCVTRIGCELPSEDLKCGLRVSLLWSHEFRNFSFLIGFRCEFGRCATTRTEGIAPTDSSGRYSVNAKSMGLQVLSMTSTIIRSENLIVDCGYLFCGHSIFHFAVLFSDFESEQYFRSYFRVDWQCL